ncbi:hypothetical protein L7F22_066576 [Adiantum nelumboides]|nr:hypothetical protein [Adiantum nelumboides]
MDHGVCKAPTPFYLLAVALRSFLLVLATHLLAGEVDTSLAGAPLARRVSWWFRYYNPLNLSWRYYSMFAYRFTVHSWGTPQLALINHEGHPLLAPLPYIVGETVQPLHVRRLELAGLLSSQGILTFSAAYQGLLAIQYAISTEGIPYLPNTTVPLAMVGLFRVLACKWVASKIHVDPYPYPCMPSAPPSLAPNVCTLLSPFLQFCKSSICSLWASSSNTIAPNKDSSSPPPSTLSASNIVSKSQMEDSLSTVLAHYKTQGDPSSASVPIITFSIGKSSPASTNMFCRSLDNSSSTLIKLPYSHLPPLELPSSIDTVNLPSPQIYSAPVLQSSDRPLLPTMSRPYSISPSSSLVMGCMPSAIGPECNAGMFLLNSLLPLSCSPSEEHRANTSKYSSTSALSLITHTSLSSSTCPNLSPISCSRVELSISPHDPKLLPSLSGKPLAGFPVHTDTSPERPLPYKSNKIMVGIWVGVLVGLVTMAFLPYKVATAYQLPHRLLQFSMQLFYQYIAVSEFVFHAYLLYQGPRALANRVLFFDHWAFKAQTVGFYCLLVFMLVIALLDFVKHEYYRTCA